MVQENGVISKSALREVETSVVTSASLIETGLFQKPKPNCNG
jgi:hypothetical protein